MAWEMARKWNTAKSLGNNFERCGYKADAFSGKIS
jgi:hypothetical protein